MSTAHESTNLKNLRTQKALGTDFLVFGDAGNSKMYMVDLDSLSLSADDTNGINTEIDSKKIEIPVAVNHEFELSDTAGNEDLLAVAWTEVVAPGNTYDIVLVAITKQNGGTYNFVKCPNASRQVSASAIPELKVFIKDGEPKLVNIIRRGTNFTLEAFGH